MGIKVITNNIPRDVLYWFDLTPDEREEFDWLLDSSTLTPEDATFFRYKGEVYCLEDMEEPHPDLIGEWDAQLCDTFFSGILVRYAREDWDTDRPLKEREIDSEYVIAGWFYSS